MYLLEIKVKAQGIICFTKFTNLLIFGHCAFDLDKSWDLWLLAYFVEFQIDNADSCTHTWLDQLVRWRRTFGMMLLKGQSQLESEVIVLNQLTMNKKVLVELAELVVSWGISISMNTSYYIKLTYHTYI